MQNEEMREIYEKTNQRAEKLSGTIITTMKVSYHVLIWPAFITTSLNYFTTDLGKEGFELPFPIR